MNEKINAILVDPLDDVATAITGLRPGEAGRYDKPNEGIKEVAIRQEIPQYHKFALRAIGKGEAVRKYGEIIGVATQDIGRGCHVHEHNIASPVGNPDKAREEWK